jgi:hypothetical protein
VIIGFLTAGLIIEGTCVNMEVSIVKNHPRITKTVKSTEQKKEEPKVNVNTEEKK